MNNPEEVTRGEKPILTEVTFLMMIKMGKFATSGLGGNPETDNFEVIRIAHLNNNILIAMLSSSPGGSICLPNLNNQGHSGAKRNRKPSFQRGQLNTDIQTKVAHGHDI